MGEAMSVDSKFDAVSELTGALACRREPLLVKLDENNCIIAAHYTYDSEHDMGIVFRHAEGLIDIGISAPTEVGEHGIEEWAESVDSNLTDGLPGLAIISNFTDMEAAEVGIKIVDTGGPASGKVPMARFSGDIGTLQAMLAEKALPYRFSFTSETDI